jgi:hypothetical protein
VVVSGSLRARGGLGVVLGRWGGGGPWLGGLGGCPWWSSLRVVVSVAAVFLCPRGPPPRCGRGGFFLGFIHFGIGRCLL